MIQAAIDHQPVNPGIEARIAAEVADAGEELDEDVLRDVHGGGFVAGEAEGDGVDLVRYCSKSARKASRSPRWHAWTSSRSASATIPLP